MNAGKGKRFKMNSRLVLKKDVRRYRNIHGTMKEIEKIVSAHLNLPISAILERWSGQGRCYHDLSHLDDLIGQIYAQNTVDRVPLVLLALMHDVIYNPRSDNNEDESRAFFDSCVKPSCPYKAVVDEGIEQTRYEGMKKPRSEIIRTFMLMDLNGLLTGDMNRFIIDEKKIFREYQWVDYAVYRATRPEFLVSIAENYSWLLPKGERAVRVSLMHAYAEYVRARRPNAGVYAGSYNPFHIGHMDVLHQAEKIFDKVIISVGMNPEKNDCRSWDVIAQERTAAIAGQVPFHQVEAFRGFLSDYLKRKAQDQKVTLIRGIRDGFDLRQEVIQLRFVQEQYPDLKVVYIPCKKEFEHISSSWLRLLESIEPGSSAQYLCVPPGKGCTGN
jgi:pantetheine-phosphate adenylyltransferase